MVPFMESAVIRSLSRGVNQSGVRDYNERLLLTLLQRNGPMAGSELARLSDLSPQTISIILREMEAEGLLARGAPVKGKVGKPSVPMSLAEDGVLSFGCKIGRRSAVLLLADFRGTVRHELQMTYKYPLPEPILGFLREGIDTILAECRAEMRKRVCGIGIGMPFELWRWNEQVGASISEFQSWKDVDAARNSATTPISSSAPSSVAASSSTIPCIRVIRAMPARWAHCAASDRRAKASN